MAHNPVTILGKSVKTGSSEAVEFYSGAATVMPYGLANALQVIKSAYGDDAQYKPKTLRKFGKTANTAASSAKTTVAEFQDGTTAGTVFNETYATDNTIDEVVSTSGSDTMVVTIEGHTLSGSELTFVTQTVTLTGQTPVPLSTPLARANRIFTTANATTTGNIYVYDSTEAVSVASGVPQTPSATKVMILAGMAQSEKGASSIGSVDYYIVTQLTISINKSGGAAQTVEFQIENRQIGNGFMPLCEFITVGSTSNPGREVNFDPPIIIPKNSDFRIVAYASAADLTVSAGINGYLATTEDL